MSFSCHIVGEGTLPIQCGDLLQRRGHQIRSVISPDSAVRAWASERGIDAAEPELGWSALVGAAAFDYLFSIVNFHIIPADVLARPRLGAINFHDGPLPRYAGSYATSWAIANGETQHGICWHAMTDLVDGGDILAQRFVPIDDGDTAVMLNAKCYQAAVVAFEGLIAELAAGVEKQIPQDLSRRTYFSRSTRPPAAAVLSWQEAPATLCALVRALNFGQYPNPLGSPKVLVGNEYVVVGDAHPASSASSAAPGSVIRVDDEIVTVATVGGDVALRRWTTLDGRELRAADLVERYDIRVGRCLPSLTAEEADALSTWYGAAAKHERFWIDVLQHVDPIVLPMAKASQSSNEEPRRRLLSIPESLTRRLYRAYPSTSRLDCVLTAFAVYASRISGVDDFTIGWRHDNWPDTRVVCNLAASLVPLRFTLSLEQSFGAALEAVASSRRRTRRRGTFSRDIVLRTPALHARRGDLTTCRPWSVVLDETASRSGVRGAQFGLCVSADDVELQYDADACDDEQAASVHGHVLAILAAAADTDRPIGELSIFESAARHRVLVEWNQTRRDYPAGSTAADLFEAQVDRTPDAIAAGFEGQTLTYRELNRRADDIAYRLRGLSVEPGVLVGVCAERSLEMLVAVLGIFKAGGAYVPLDPAFPRERLAYMASDAALRVVVTKGDVAELVADSSRAIVNLDADGVVPALQQADRPGRRSTSEDLAYVLYTSGSTGKPKGVEVSQRALTNFLWAMRAQPGCSAADIVLAITTLSFDIAGLELFLPLICGGRVEIASRRTSADGRRLQELIEQRGVTMMQATPATWRMLIETGWQGSPRLTALCGGEALPVDLAHALMTRTAALWNMYGPTETTIWSSIRRVRAEDAEITIGTPIANTEFYVLDERRQPVPIGAPGELYIGGHGLARGYRNRPDLTAERFVRHPFNEEIGARLYRTGDLVRYRPDGQVIHLGRLDHQVKIRGFRIELGEIEAILAMHRAVQSAVVVPRDTDKSGSAYLAAYVVPRSGMSLAVAELRAALQEAVPEYMIPSVFVLMSTLPMTPNGKVDRKALPEPERDRASLASAYVAPRTPIEASIVAVWRTALRIEQIGVNDNFFELGGHSLSGLEISMRLVDAVGVELPLQMLFEYPTPAALATRVEEALVAQAGDDVLAQLLDQITGAPASSSAASGSPYSSRSTDR
jgi:amino acid adenylation domain-containing protein